MPTEPTDDPQVIDGIVALRLAAIRQHQHFAGGDAAQSKMCEFVTKAASSTPSEGALELLREGSITRAHLTIWQEDESWYGSPAQMCMTDHRIGDVVRREGETIDAGQHLPVLQVVALLGGAGGGEFVAVDFECGDHAATVARRMRP